MTPDRVRRAEMLQRVIERMYRLKPGTLFVVSDEIEQLGETQLATRLIERGRAARWAINRGKEIKP